MANSYTQLHIQFIFAVKFRNGLLHSSWRDELFKYITGIVQNHDHKMLCVNGVEDHIHILVGMKPKQSVSDLVQDVKSSSSKWINERGFTAGRFAWQDGYGAFSYSKSDLEKLIKYIKNQEEHHHKKSFKEEYLEFLEKFEIEYNEKYIFQEPV